MTSNSVPRQLAEVNLCVLVSLSNETGPLKSSDLENLIASLMEARVGMIQLRDKSRSDRELVHGARLIRRLTKQAGAIFVINDRVDIGLAIEADGVHLGQDDLDYSLARKILGPEKIIGISTHSVEQAKVAQSEGADYIGVGPVFPSQTKSFSTHVGTELIQQVATTIHIPAFAIGGIGHANVGSIVDAGIRRAAVSGSVIHAEDPGKAAKRLLRSLRK